MSDMTTCEHTTTTRKLVTLGIRGATVGHVEVLRCQDCGLWLTHEGAEMTQDECDRYGLSNH